MKLFPNRCYNGGQLHNFEAVYSEESRDSDLYVWLLDPDDIHRLTILKIYKGHICKWCGTVINDQRDKTKEDR